MTRNGRKTKKEREKNIMTNRKLTCTVVEEEKERNFTSYDKML